MWLLAYIGATLAGAVLVLRELGPWLSARRTGVIYKKGARRERVERDVDPERFEALCHNRRQAMTPGLILFGVGLVLTVSYAAGLSAHLAASGG